MSADRPTLEDLLDDPAVSYPLKAVLLVWLGRDPVDAANDAAVLAAVIDDRAAGALERRHGP